MNKYVVTLKDGAVHTVYAGHYTFHLGYYSSVCEFHEYLRERRLFAAEEWGPKVASFAPSEVLSIKRVTGGNQ